MEDSESISGKKILQVIRQLRDDRIVLNLSLIGKDYERLTIVTGIKIRNGRPFILIDTPGEFEEVSEDAPGSRIVFEFSGSNHTPYRFRTEIANAGEDEIWVKFPELIERIQRRRNFRLAPPMGTEILINDQNGKYEFNVINVSLGGVLLIEKKSLFIDKTRPQPEGFLRNVHLVCHKQGMRTKIRIKKSLIKRMEKDSKTRRHRCALEFVELEKKQINDLEDFLQNCQREILKKRSALG
ncbi:PilZ domain-containing protein [Thermodesulfobacteriota bacterium]